MKRYLKVKGGLGNQMFQYAFYLAMKRKGIDISLDVTIYKTLKIHNGFELSGIFGIKDQTYSFPRLINVLYNIVEHFFRGAITTYDNRNVCFNFSKSKRFLSGYWQSEEYFKCFKDDIYRTFQFQNIDERNRSLAKEMQSCESVSLHIRRGDYVGLAIYENVCTEDYYCRAVAHILENIESPMFYIFSNDVDWSRKFAESLGIRFILITHNLGANSYKDMYLMTKCRHNIIANSSFSWWGSYLNGNENSIKIAPNGWDNSDSPEYNKIRVPSEYIRL